MIVVTQGKLQTSVAVMAVGDTITARYTTTSMTAHGTFSEIGTANTAVLNQFSSTNLDGYIYLLKIAKGVLVSCSQLYSGVTYSTFNAVNKVYGDKVTIEGRDYLIRLPKISEYIAMCGDLNGMLDPIDRYDNFGVPNSGVGILEVIQENYNLGEGAWSFVTTPATVNNASANSTAKYARLVLEYADDPKCTDLYH